MSTKNTYFHTRFWQDNYISELDPSEKLLFVYSITSPSLGLTGIYETPLKYIALDTGIDREMVAKILSRFQKDKKIAYKDGWLCVVNYPKYQSFKGEPLLKAVKKEIDAIPVEILNYFIDYGYPIDTLSIGYMVWNGNGNGNGNGNSKEEKNVFGEFKNVKLTEEEYQKLVDAIGEQPTEYLIAELSSYLASSGKRYKSHYATLQNWARRKIQEYAKSKQNTNNKILEI